MCIFKETLIKPRFVIASEAKQSTAAISAISDGLSRRCAPRNDEFVLGLLRLCFFLLLGLVAGLGSGSVRADDWSAAQLSCPAHQPIAQLFEQRGLASDQPVLLYLWSPRMVLSVQHAHAVQQVAQSLGLQWLAVRDPRLPQAEAEAALASLPAAQALHPVQALCDQGLLMQAQTLRHFPTAWVFRREVANEYAGVAWQQQGLPIVSAMPPVFWRQAILERQALSVVSQHVVPNKSKSSHGWQVVCRGVGTVEIVVGNPMGQFGCSGL